MVLWLRAPATLSEGLGAIPSTHTVAHTTHSYSSVRSSALFWSVGILAGETPVYIK